MHTHYKIAFACGNYAFLIGALSREKLVLLYAYYICTGQPAHQRNSLSIALARRLGAKFWPDRAIPDTSMKSGTVVDHD